MLIQIVTDKCVIKIIYFVIYVYQKLLPIVTKIVTVCNKIWTNEYFGQSWGSFGKRVQTVTIWIFSFELENLNWVIWTKNLNCCLGQIILFECIIWIVVWVDVKCVMLSNKKSSWNVKSKNTIQNGFKLLKFEGGKNLILKGLNDFFSFKFYLKKHNQTTIQIGKVV